MNDQHWIRFAECVLWMIAGAALAAGMPLAFVAAVVTIVVLNVFHVPPATVFRDRPPQEVQQGVPWVWQVDYWTTFNGNGWMPAFGAVYSDPVDAITKATAMHVAGYRVRVVHVQVIDEVANT